MRAMEDTKKKEEKMRRDEFQRGGETAFSTQLWGKRQVDM